MSTDQQIEQEIVAKGKTAPRVTPDDIKAAIASEHYFTASQAVGMKYTPPAEMDLLTFCVLVLQNGFTVTGESACVSPENFNAEKGRQIARENAEAKIWPLLGYALKDELHRRAVFDASPKCGPGPDTQASTLQPHQQRVLDEKAELDEKIEKLNNFIMLPGPGSFFSNLPDEEQSRLRTQLVAMKAYSDILGERIAAFGQVSA